jgi:hypothetical protein
VVRSGTASKLERDVPNGEHIFSYYRHLIVSLDYAKAERRVASFVTHCPDLVIVDEAHTCANRSSKNSSQQQRHQLIKEIAQKQQRHLLLLTATPHSGIEEAFLSLLGLLKPEFEQLTLDKLTEQQRDSLASHFIQRRRADVKLWLGNETPFPTRDSEENPYKLSKEYRALFDNVYEFARSLVKTTTHEMSYAQRRGRYWSALALIRCVMSSPAAAIATLSKKGNGDSEETLVLDEGLMASYVFDSTEREQVTDASPVCSSALAHSYNFENQDVVCSSALAHSGNFENQDVVCSSALAHSGNFNKEALKRNYEPKLKAFIKAAENLQGSKDHKLQSCIASVKGKLQSYYLVSLYCYSKLCGKRAKAKIREKR